MERAIEKIPTGFIQSMAYEDKYGLSPGQGRVFAKRGLLKTFGEGRASESNIYLEDKYVATYRHARVRSDGKLLCGSCLEYLPESEYYPSALRRGQQSRCRICIRHRDKKGAGKADPVDTMLHGMGREIASQLINISAEALAEREDRIAAHAARIESLGLSGDGEGWPDHAD